MIAPTIATVLFDADGVLQHPVERWSAAFGRKFAMTGDALDALAQSVNAIELDHLTREDGFTDELEAILRKWKLAEHLTDVLQILNAIHVDTDIIDIVRELRACGVHCHIATNQQSHRARHMSELIGYRHIFNREFYSCRIGMRKPDIGFFKFIVSELDVSPGSILFIDDREENVTSATAAGIQASLFPITGGAEAMRDVLARFALWRSSAQNHQALGEPDNHI